MTAARPQANRRKYLNLKPSGDQASVDVVPERPFFFNLSKPPLLLRQLYNLSLRHPPTRTLHACFDRRGMKSKNSPRYYIGFSDLDTKLFLVLYLERIRPLLWRHQASGSAGEIVTRLRAARADASKSTDFPVSHFLVSGRVGPNLLLLAFIGWCKFTKISPLY
jgi:hypothetical protein